MENSNIEWTHHTFNPWWGCMKVSAGCKNCYAEVRDNWLHHSQPHWGPDSNRKMMSDSYWQRPVKWNAAAKAAGVRHRVFCASMADVFEGHPDTLPALSRLFEFIVATPHLDWLLLTKRPENIMTLVTAGPWRGVFPPNVWVGTSVENQEAADKRIPHLLEVPARVRFLSMEPLLSSVRLDNIFITCPVCDGSASVPIDGGGIACSKCYLPNGFQGQISGISWVIVGGESGPNARPMHPDWATSIRDQCAAAGVPFFFKQWGEWAPLYMPHLMNNPPRLQKNEQYLNLAGGQGYHGDNVYCVQKRSKKENGRLLDGILHDNFPII